MNSDSSTYEIPEYISSRLNPRIVVDFPNRIDELKILKYNLPFASEEILEYCVDFLQNSHDNAEPTTVRDGINILRYYMKTRTLNSKKMESLNKKEFKDAIIHVLDDLAVRYCSDEYENFINEKEKSMRNIFRILNDDE